MFSLIKIQYNAAIPYAHTSQAYKHVQYWYYINLYIYMLARIKCVLMKLDAGSTNTMTKLSVKVPICGVHSNSTGMSTREISRTSDVLPLFPMSVLSSSQRIHHPAAPTPN